MCDRACVFACAVFHVAHTGIGTSISVKLPVFRFRSFARSLAVSFTFFALVYRYAQSVLLALPLLSCEAGVLRSLCGLGEAVTGSCHAFRDVLQAPIVNMSVGVRYVGLCTS